MAKEKEDKVEKDETTLEDKVDEKMNAIFRSETEDEEDVEDDVDDVDDTDEDDDSSASTAEDEEGDADADDEEVDENDDDTSSESEKKTDETLTLPAAHIQTALRLGMSEEEVKEHFDKDPKFMISALEKLHVGENNLSARYAQMGRAIQEKDLGAAKAKNKGDDTGSSDALVDIEKLRAKFDSDDDEMTALIDGVIKPLNDALVDLKKQTGSRGQPTGQDAYNQQEERAINSEINNFFDSDNLKEFRDYYGTVKPGEDPRVVLTGSQFQHRGQVCTEGNLIRIGAEFSGDKLTITDVLQRAHLQLTEPLREEMLRKGIASNIKKRSKGLSIKAGVKKTSKTPTEKDPTKRLETKTKERLKKLFG
jgi:hypothetical protein